jgi:hypothetical protein
MACGRFSGRRAQAALLWGRRTNVAKTDKKGAGKAGAGKPDDKASDKAAAERGAGQGSAKPSGDSPKPHGDPLLHVVKDE